MYSPVLFVYVGEKDTIKTYLQESLTTLKAAKFFDNKLLNRWFTGIDLINEDSTDKNTYVYYFLAEPIELHKRLLKNTDSTKGLLKLNSTHCFKTVSLCGRNKQPFSGSSCKNKHTPTQSIGGVDSLLKAYKDVRF